MINYKGQQLDIKAGDLVLFYNPFKWYDPSTWLSWAIRSFTNCKYSHAAVVVSNWEILFLNEALAGGVEARPLQEHLDRGESILIRRPKTLVDEQAFSIQANSKLGIPYGYKDLILNEPIFRVFKKWLGHTAQFANSTMVCSQYAAWCYNLDNYWLYSDKELLASNYFDTIYTID